jgi:hypothetical protein
MVEYFFISSVTNGIWRSLCNVRFETPWGIGYGAQYIWLKSLKYFSVRWFSTSPKLNPILCWFNWRRYFNCMGEALGPSIKTGFKPSLMSVGQFVVHKMVTGRFLFEGSWLLAAKYLCYIIVHLEHWASRHYPGLQLGLSVSQVPWLDSKVMPSDLRDNGARKESEYDWIFGFHRLLHRPGQEVRYMNEHLNVHCEKW